jgi:uncharacterized protein (DUF1697 family)
MKTYISILRGINVSGQKLIRMEDLRKSFERLSFSAVTTYIQSGNVVFRAEGRPPTELAGIISGQIMKDAGFEVPVIVLTPADLEEAVNGNPFTQDPGMDPGFMHITFLSEEPVAFDPAKVLEKKAEGEEIAFSGKVIYLYCPYGYGRTKLTNTFLEAKLKVTATTRNLKTVKELLKIAEKL